MSRRLCDQRLGSRAAAAHAADLHLYGCVELFPSQIRVGCCSTEHVKQRFRLRVVGNGGFGGDVLSEDVEWHRWKLKPVKHAGARGMHESRAFDPAVNRHREQCPIRDLALHPPRAANPLQECRDALWRTELTNQIDRADVDPEFKR